jgi:hypothetical protein
MTSFLGVLNCVFLLGSVFVSTDAWTDKQLIGRQIHRSQQRHNCEVSVLRSKSTDDLGSVFLEALFGILDSGKQYNEKEDPNKVLAEFTSLAVFNSTIKNDVLLAHDSLERYLRQWAFLLETDSGLSTPITSSTKPLRRRENSTISSGLNETRKKDCIRIMFCPPPRYLSYNEQRGLEKGLLPDRKGAKLDSKSPGGVQLIIQSQTKLVTNDEGTKDDCELQLVASRCGVDEDTLIKLSSERIIIRRLNEAIRIWKKSRGSAITCSKS